MAAVKVHILVSGEVQGVGFRLAARQKMEDLGVGGVVTNLPDGRVEAVFEGNGEKIVEMVEWCREGPPLAKVSQVEVVTKL